MDNASPVGVSITRRPAEADIVVPDDLPGHLIELHAFRGSEAGVFADGVNYGGGNAVAAVAHDNIVLVARFNGERPLADCLDDAVPLFDRTHGLLEDIRRGSARREHDVARKDAELAEQQAVRASWAKVIAALEAFPRAPDGHPVLEIDHHGLARDRMGVSGSFDPSVPWVRYGVGSVGFQATIVRGADGGVGIHTPYRLPGGQDGIAHRLEEIRAACNGAGFAFDEDALQPVRRTADADGLIEGLMGLPPLWRRIRDLAGESCRVVQAQALIDDHELMRCLEAMGKGATIRAFSSSPGRMTSPDGKGRQVTATMIRRLADLGFIVEDPKPQDYAVTWAISDLGRVALARDAEALAAARQGGDNPHADVPGPRV